MIIEDYTLNKKFSELKEGTCFVMYSEYYMKLYIKYYEEYSEYYMKLFAKYYDEYSSKTALTYRSYAVNLKTGVAEVVKDDEKVRIVDGTIIIK